MLGLLSSSLFTVLGAPTHGAVMNRCERAFCRCIPASALGLSVEELVRRQRERAARVVLGRVVRVDTLAPYMVEHGPAQVASRAVAARVAVSRVWKGSGVDTLTVVFGSIGVASSCDLSLEAGFSYVIFASRGDDGLLYAGQCTGTALEEHAASTLSALGPGQEPTR